MVEAIDIQIIVSIIISNRIETGLVLTHSFDHHFSLDGQIVWYQIDNLSNLCLSYNQTYHALTHDLMCHFLLIIEALFIKMMVS